jgi:DNA-binding FadR family transcriptional regulator
VIRVHILENIFELYVEFINFVIAAVTRKKSETRLNLRLHQKIFEAIEAGDSDLARETMMKMFTWIEGRWKKADDNAP